MQQLDNSLDNIGYTYSRKLLDPGVVLSTEASSESLVKRTNNNKGVFILTFFFFKCHYYDVLIKDPKQESGKEKKNLFYNGYKKMILTGPKKNLGFLKHSTRSFQHLIIHK
jgi:hypothetical protein